MTVTSPAEFLQDLDFNFFEHYKGTKGRDLSPVHYVEPRPRSDEPSEPTQIPSSEKATATASPPDKSPAGLKMVKSKVIRLGDFIDTDALAPGPTLTTCTTDKEFGQHVLEYTYPEFRGKVANGQQVVVAGNAFGVGSSRLAQGRRVGFSRLARHSAKSEGRG